MVKSPYSLDTERSIRMSRHMNILNQYERGDRVDKIQEMFDCSRGTVLRLARKAGMPKRPKHFPDQVKKATLALLKDNRPYAEIQARLGVSAGYVSKLAKANGLNRYGRK